MPTVKDWINHFKNEPDQNQVEKFNQYLYELDQDSMFHKNYGIDIENLRYAITTAQHELKNILERS